MNHAKAGQRIRLVEMPSDPAPIEAGTEGTVTAVQLFPGYDAWAQIQVRWDNGRTLALCVPPDRYEVVVPDPQPIDTAPCDGSTVLVFHGPRQVSARAYWHGGVQGWVDFDRPAAEPKVLQNVRWWQP